MDSFWGHFLYCYATVVDVVDVKAVIGATLRSLLAAPPAPSIMDLQMSFHPYAMELSDLSSISLKI